MSNTESQEAIHPAGMELAEPHEGVQEPAPAPAKSRRSKLETVVLMTTLCSAVFLAALDITIVSTALPMIADHFQSTLGYTWIGSAFLLAAAVVAPSWGKFSDIWGRKSVLLVAITIFFVGSVLCGAAPVLWVLLLGRTIQGAAGGGLLALVSIVVGDLFSQRDRGKYYGIVGLVWAVAFTLGPLIGGAFTNGVSWRWCFYINLPISGVALIIIFFMLKLETPKTPFIAGMKAVDWVGSLAMAAGFLMFLFGLVLGGTTYPWNSATIICLIIFGIVTLAIFVFIERYWARYPIVPVHLYTNLSNLAVFAVNLLHGIVLTCCTYFLPLYCQSVLEASPFLSGVLLLPFAVSMSIATVGSGMYVKRTGRYLDCIRIGFLLMILGVGLFYDLPDSRYWPKIILYQLIPGFGIGLNFQPPMIALQNNVPAQDNGAATASFGLVRNVASALGVVIGSVAFSNAMTAQQGRLLQVFDGNTTSAELFSGANAQASVLLIDQFTEVQQDAVRNTFWVALRDIWIIAVSLAAAGGLICLFIGKKKLNKIHVEVKMGLAGEEERRRIALEQRAGRSPKGDDHADV